MKKIFSKKYWIASVSVLLVAGGIAWACAGADWEDIRPTNFRADGLVDNIYRPFFYSYYFYNDIGYDEQHNSRFNEVNVRDWSTYFDNKVANEELDYLLNQASAGLADSTLAFTSGKIKTLPAPVRSFRLLSLKNDKAAEFLKYISIAKSCEAFAVVHREWWQEKTPAKEFAGAARLNAELLSRFNKTQDLFLKQRYWFQLVRSYFFNNPPAQAIELFEKNKAAFAQNTIYYRTLAYAAGGYYAQKNYSKANYYYSLVYDGCNALKTVAHYSFHPQEEQDWRSTLALCRNKDEQVTLWQMLGVQYNDEKRSIEEIYKLNPSSEKLELLLLRAVNKEEAGTAENYNSKEQPALMSKPVDPELLSLVTRIAKSGNTSKPYLWQISAGYLHTLNSDFENAKQLYALAQRSVSKNEKAKMQFRLFTLMNKIALAKRVDKKFENEILDDLYWLSNQDPHNNEFRFDNAMNWMRAVMAYKYQRQQELVKSECFKSSAAFYLLKANVEAMKTFIQKPGKTAYEQLCNKFYDKSLSDLWEFQAIQYTHAGKLAEAVAAFEKDTVNIGKELLGNPFNGRINDCHDCDHQAKVKTQYTRLAFVKKMKEMQDKMVKGEDVYNNAMLLGNAFYNITHYGNARRFYESRVIGYSGSHPYSYIDTAFNTITSMRQAAKYYGLALQAATTNEQKAKCHYMLAKCERNEWYNAEVYSGRENTESDTIDFKAWEGFKALKNYTDTKYYQEVIKECGYFREYVR